MWMVAKSVSGFLFKSYQKQMEFRMLSFCYALYQIYLQLAIMSYQRYLLFIIRKCKYVASDLDM